MDREKLLNAAIGKELVGVVSPVLAWNIGFAAALSLLQWRDVADGLPEVSGFYVVELRSKLHELDGTAIAAAKFEVGKSLWMNVRAYIPYPIPPYKEQR